MKEVYMTDVTALADQYWKSLSLPSKYQNDPALRQIIIGAFESGYVAHRHPGLENG